MKIKRVLMLNASWEPIRIISIYRAIILVVEDKAEIVEAVEGEAIRSPSLTLPYPSVIRLFKYVKVPLKRKKIPISRRAVLNRDGKECAYCGGVADTIDHIRPRSRGGKHIWGNVVAACKKCNAKKGNRQLSELGWVLRYKPIVPEEPRERWAVIGITDDVWNGYLEPSY